MGTLNVVQVVLLGMMPTWSGRCASRTWHHHRILFSVREGEVSDRAITFRVLCTVYHSTTPHWHRQTAIPLTTILRGSMLHSSLFPGHVVRNTPRPSVPRCYPLGLSATTFQQMRAFAKQLVLALVYQKEACPSHLASSTRTYVCTHIDAVPCQQRCICGFTKWCVIGSHT
jgi:hypothetical protein